MVLPRKKLQKGGHLAQAAKVLFARFGPLPVWLGSLRRVTPVSSRFGFDRGKPIDRYFIENFLAKNAADVHGRVLEVGDNTYTSRFGGERVTVSDVLYVEAGNPQATIVADLAEAPHIPANTFDCIILTQTLHLIYDVKAAVRTLERILKPGGVLLATFPGISPIDRHNWGYTWYWNFTSRSAQRLFSEEFCSDQLMVETYGNVLVAVAFLEGLAVSDLQQAELDYIDPSYEVVISVRAVKTEGPGE